MTHDPSPREALTPEEQAMARRLARLGADAAPSPTLDARILAAARAADAGARPLPPSRRWTVALGVAASLVLAIGIAWRLRPLPGPARDREPMASPTPAAAPAARSGTAGTAMPAGAMPPEPDAATPAPPSPSPPAPLRARVAPPRPTEVPASTPAPEPPVVLEAPAPAARMAALPAPPPPASAAPEMQSRSTAPAREATTGQATEEAVVDASAAAGQAAGDEPESEVPPATADAPDVRDAWLQRIRELVAAGQTDAARASLKEFVRRHPDAPLPDDLRALQR